MTHGAATGSHRKEHADGLCGAKGEVHPPAEAARRAANAAGDVHDQGPLRADLDVELGELRAQLEGGGAVAQKEDAARLIVHKV